MPEPTFGPDKCQARSRHLSIKAFVPSRHLSFEAFVLLVDKCLYRHLSYQAFVFRGICLLTETASAWNTSEDGRLSLVRAN